MEAVFGPDARSLRALRVRGRGLERAWVLGTGLGGGNRETALQDSVSVADEALVVQSEGSRGTSGRVLARKGMTTVSHSRGI